MDELKIIAKDIHSAIRDGNNELAIKLLRNHRHLGILNFKTPFGTWLHDAALHNRKILLYTWCQQELILMNKVDPTW